MRAGRVMAECLFMPCVLSARIKLLIFSVRVAASSFFLI